MDLKRLLGKHGPSISILGNEKTEELFRPPHERAAMVMRRIRGHKAKTTAALFDELAAALQFPAYFGENWNAVDDCLNDLEWLHGDAYVLVFERAPEILALEPPAEFESLFQVLTRASEEWRERKKAFHTMLVCNKPEEKTLRQKLTAAKIEITES